MTINIWRIGFIVSNLLLAQFSPNYLDVPRRWLADPLDRDGTVAPDPRGEGVIWDRLI